MKLIIYWYKQYILQTVDSCTNLESDLQPTVKVSFLQLYKIHKVIFF